MPNTTQAERAGRDRRLNIRLSDAEMDVLERATSLAGVTKTAYIVSLITGQKAFPAKERSVEKVEHSGRSRRLSVRFNDAETDMLNLSAKKAGMTKTAYLSSLVTGEHNFIVVDNDILRQTLLELVRQGTNLNQIAYQLNLLAKSPYLEGRELLVDGAIKDLNLSFDARNDAYQEVINLLGQLNDKRV